MIYLFYSGNLNLTKLKFSIIPIIFYFIKYNLIIKEIVILKFYKT